VTAGGRAQRRDIASGDSYMSSHDPRLHFGLGEVESVERIDVRWPDGTHSIRDNLPARQSITIRKGS
jgi:enediyne biosynthesis protein E4